MSNNTSPQYTLFQNLKDMILKLKKRIENNENEIENLKSKIDSSTEELSKVTDYVNDREVQKNLFLKIFEGAKKIPGYIVAIISAIIALLTYLSEHFNFIP